MTRRHKIFIGSFVVVFLAAMNLVLRVGEQDKFHFPSLPGPMRSVKLEELSTEMQDELAWNDPRNIVFGDRGLELLLGKMRFDSVVRLTLDGNDRYSLVFLNGDTKLAAVDLPPVEGRGLRIRHAVVPENARVAGYDRIQILPIIGDGRYATGSVMFLSARGFGPTRLLAPPDSKVDQ